MIHIQFTKYLTEKPITMQKLQQQKLFELGPRWLTMHKQAFWTSSISRNPKR
jgi:hypothetical protein